MFASIMYRLDSGKGPGPAARWLVLFGATCLLSAHALSAPNIEHWSTANDARVYFVAAPELPIVDVRVVFDAGSARDGKMGGLAQLTSSLLDDGAGTLDANEIAEHFDQVGAIFGTSVDQDTMTVSLRTLVDPPLRSRALSTLALILSQPSFPQVSFERERNQMVTGLRAERQSPGAIAGRAFYRAVYADHPYAGMVSGTEESVSVLSQRDVAEYQRRYLVASNAVIAIVGSVSRAEAEAIATQLTEGLRRGKPAPPLPSVTSLEEAKFVEIPHPSTQSHVLIGTTGVSRKDPDYFSLYLGNFILGGSGLVSLLSEEVREKRGLSYSVYSYFLPLKEQGPFVIGLQTRNDQVGEAVAVVNETLKSYVELGPQAQTLVAAKQNITGGFPLRIDSNRKIADYLAVIGFYELPLDYLDTFTSRIEQVTANEIKDAFRRRVVLNKMVTVIVGDGGDHP